MPDPETIPVPDLVSLTQSAAEAKLRSAGLVVGTVNTAGSPTIPEGSVSNVKPAAGTPISPGSTVSLEVSSGPAAQVEVPNVIGRTRGAAEAMLKSAGVVVGTLTTQHSHSVPADGVSNTSPKAGTLVSPSSPVDLELSTGPEPTWTQYVVPIIIVTLLGGLTLLGIVYAIVEPSGLILGRLKEKDAARGLITFLIAIATVGIAILLAVSTLILREGDASEKRFDRGKQVLAILIGVLGTIVGFYFGSETTPTQIPPTLQTQTSAPKITTTTLPDGAVNKTYPSTTLQTTGLTTPLKWSVTPALPAGVVLDAVAGTISGTPTAARPKTSFKFTVTDSTAPAVTSTADLTLEIR